MLVVNNYVDLLDFPINHSQLINVNKIDCFSCDDIFLYMKLQVTEMLTLRTPINLDII